MVAKLQRAIAFSVLLVAISVAGLLSWAGFPVLGLVAAAAILCGHAFVLAVEFICMTGVETHQRRPSLSAVIRAWADEAIVFPQVFYWRQPFRAGAEPDHLPPTAQPVRGVVLIHGLTCNRGFWNPWLKRLRRRGIPCIAPNLEPVFGSIEAYATAIDAAVRRLSAVTGSPPVIVAHSMGGLAVRHWMSARRAADRVSHVVTIGTPHHGTWMARFGRPPSGPEMMIGSDWLVRLASNEETSARGKQFTCFYSDCDNIVFPSSNAQLVGADNRCVPGVAHVALAFSEEVFLEARRWLSAPVEGQ